MWVMLYQWAYLQACESICVMLLASVFFFFPIFRVKFKICSLAEKPHMHLVSHEFMICFIYHFNLLLGLYIGGLLVCIICYVNVVVILHFIIFAYLCYPCCEGTEF